VGMYNHILITEESGTINLYFKTVFHKAAMTFISKDVAIWQILCKPVITETITSSKKLIYNE